MISGATLRGLAGATVAVLASCGSRPSGTGGEAQPPSSASAFEAGAGERSPIAAIDDARTKDLWERANKEGEVDDFARLADHVGTPALEAALADKERRVSALRALGHSPGFGQLLPLAKAAKEGPDADAEGAFTSIRLLALRPVKSEDQEELSEMREGCAVLVALATDKGAPGPRRKNALSVLRMLKERGCVAAKDIPAE